MCDRSCDGCVECNAARAENEEHRRLSEEPAAKAEGAIARANGVRYRDNPYRTGEKASKLYLYSAWEWGWSRGLDASTLRALTLAPVVHLPHVATLPDGATIAIPAGTRIALSSFEPKGSDR